MTKNEALQQFSGGISGAISDPLSKEAIAHAELYYEEIRHRNDDIAKIAERTGFTKEQVLKVKNYLFIETHCLGERVRRFDPSFEIAESWQRLSDNNQVIQEHDKLLIPHELMEMDYVMRGYSQDKAHIKTCEDYDYPAATNRYYSELQIKEYQRQAKNTISGGITHKSRDDWDLCM